jgi:hypothetical protein
VLQLHFVFAVPTSNIFEWIEMLLISRYYCAVRFCWKLFHHIRRWGTEIPFVYFQPKSYSLQFVLENLLYIVSHNHNNNLCHMLWHHCSAPLSEVISSQQNKHAYLNKITIFLVFQQHSIRAGNTFAVTWRRFLGSNQMAFSPPLYMAEKWTVDQNCPV